MISSSLNFGFHFSDLYNLRALNKLDHNFLSFLKRYDEKLYEALLIYRNNPPSSFPSDFILAIAPVFEDYLVKLFNVEDAFADLQIKYGQYAPVIRVKRNFVQRFALKKYPSFDDNDAVDENFVFTDEISFSKQVENWLVCEQDYQDELDLAARYAAWATLTKKGQEKHSNHILFKKPKIQNFDTLIPNLVKNQDNAFEIDLSRRVNREGFNLTDHGFSPEQAFDQANYCIWCHHQGKDSCAKGMPSKKDISSKFLKNPLGQDLTGCPLEQKISEMNELISNGHLLAALAVICIDNPLVAATGHRICNDCVKACIFQKQDPVQIPATETKILKDILNLPWGFEIYSLLTRWNPLNLENPLPKPLSNKTILVVGMGPAGFTLSHYLLNEGHTVIGIDALKIEPLPDSLKNIGEELLPIENVQNLYENLEDRIIWGFGGVAEYGITVRWDKNFLKIIRILLERRQHFSMFGGVRFGGALTIDQAFNLGIDHIALCMGAGSPTTLNIKNPLATGIRQASDFLMALQLGGAFKQNSLTNLQIQLPVVVIGGGLTAIDSATEAMAYYPAQVEKFLKRFEDVATIHGNDAVWGIWSDTEKNIAQTFLDHAKLFRNERERAASEKRQPDFQTIIKRLGGVSIIYRKLLKESPSYRGSYEELAKAFEQGVQFIENAIPIEFVINEDGYVQGIKAQCDGEEVVVKAKSVLVAAGTKPNISLVEDIPQQIKTVQCSDRRIFQTINFDRKQVEHELNCKPLKCDILTRLDDDGRAVTFFGDQHPSFEGNVVKAMASAKNGYKTITKLLENVKNSVLLTPLETIEKWKDLLGACVVDVKALAHNTAELIIKAPLAAQAFKPGNFFRLQIFETTQQYLPITKGIALTGVHANKEKGTISTIVVEKGASTNFCKKLKNGDPIIFMGPTGSATYIPTNKTVLLIGEGAGNAALLSIANAMRANKCKILYLASFRSIQDVFKAEEIKQTCDKVVWCFEKDSPNSSDSFLKQEIVFKGSVNDALLWYCQHVEEFSIKPFDVEHILALGSDKTLLSVEELYENRLKPFFHPHHVAVIGVNSAMQCMMKKVCGQCLQLKKDVLTGKEYIVFNCVNREHDLGAIDLNILSKRLNQNSVHEKLTNLWVGSIL